jgi:predicted anti-sigma-YlaC factor YlaD
MKCEELLAALNDYVDGTLSPEFCAGFEEHLKGCNPCEIVIDNIRNTIRLYKAGEPYKVPPELHEQLCKVLREKWRAKFRSGDIQ